MKTDNEKYVRRGRALIVHDDSESHVEVKKANHHKVGVPFQYADSFFASLVAVKSMIHIPYRNLMDMVLEVYKDAKVFHYTTIFRRIRSLDVQTNGGTVSHRRHGHDPICGRLYGPQAAQQWRVAEAKVEGKGRFVKMHIVVDVDTRKILAVRITDDRTGDSPMFIPLPDDALENCVHPASESSHADSPARYSAYGDAAYASRDIIKACRERSVDPLIRLKVSSTPRGGGAGDTWGMAVRDQLGGSVSNRIGRLSDRRRKATRKSGRCESNTTGGGLRRSCFLPSRGCLESAYTR